MMSVLKAADPVRDQVVPYDEVLLCEILGQPRPVPAKRRSRRKAVIAVWLSVILVPAAGVGAAAAAGLIPQHAKQALPWAQGGYPFLPTMDLSTSVRTISAPGPEGRRFEVWVVKDARGDVCDGRLFVGPTPTTAADLLRLRPAQGGSCGKPADAAIDPGCSTAWGPGNYTTFSCAAYGAVRGEVKLPNGTTLPVFVQNGWVGGWLPLGVQPEGVLLTTYRADGSRVVHSNLA